MDKKSNVYLPNLFSVFLETSWKLSIGDKETSEQIFPSIRYNKFLDTLASDGHSLKVLLNLINHELNFTEEGSVELKINYIGSLDTQAKSNDTDFLYANYKRLLTKRLEANSGNQAKLDKINEYVENCVKQDDTQSKESYTKQKDELSKSITEENKKQGAIEESAMNALHQEFMQYLISKRISDMKVLYLDSKAAIDWNATISQPNRPVDTQNDNFVLGSIKRVNSQFLKPKMQSAEVLQQTSEMREVYGSKKDATFNSRESEIKDIEEYVKDRKIEDDSASIVVIPLGVLLDGFLSYLKETLPTDFNKHLFFILGDFGYRIRKQEKIIKLPLAKLPIPLTSFQQWYTDVILKPEAKNFPLFDFLDNFFTKLVIPTLAGLAPSTSTIGNVYSYKMVPKQAQMIINDDLITKIKSPFEITRARVLTQDLVSKINTGGTPESTLETCNFIYFSIETAEQTPQTGLEFKGVELDQQKGISHIWVGNSVGLVKSIKFKRVEQPGLKEARATKEAFIPLHQLRDLYNADITMFGNHYYAPGQKIYIHPQNSVLGEPYVKGSLSNIMGIGGYYDIIKISTNIGDGGYETTLDCVWHSSGERQINDTTALDQRCSQLKGEITPSSAPPSSSEPEVSEP